jgi:hypothetical protein
MEPADRYRRGVLKAQDIVVLLKVAVSAAGWSFAQLGDQLGMSASAVHRSLGRAKASGLYDARRRKVSLARAPDPHRVDHGEQPVERGVPAGGPRNARMERLEDGHARLRLGVDPDGRVPPGGCDLAREGLAPQAVGVAARQLDKLLTGR